MPQMVIVIQQVTLPRVLARRLIGIAHRFQAIVVSRILNVLVEFVSRHQVPFRELLAILMLIAQLPLLIGVAPAAESQVNLGLPYPITKMFCHQDLH